MVELTTPEDSAELTYLHDAVGTATDDNLYRWYVSVRFIGEANEQVLFEGHESVTADVLGQIDATQLINGLYMLRLYAEDVNGNASDVTRPVVVRGDAKLGVVRFDLTDIAMPTHDVPLTVTRHYDSTDLREGDFGYGWRHRGVGRDGLRPRARWVRRMSSGRCGGQFTLPCTH